MIIFRTLSWKNFLSTGNTPNKVILNKSSTTLIIGKNGEGKSTILDALCFSLFSKPFRNINKNQMINSINGKNTVVEIEFSIGNKEYKIIRGIKPNIFEIWLDGEMINQDAAARDYQKILEQQILKLNYKTFTQVVILGSASFVPFMQLTTMQRKDVIEDILDIRIFSTMNQLLKDKQSNTKDELIRVESEIVIAKERIESQNAIIRTISHAKAETINTLMTKITENYSLIKNNTDNIGLLRDGIATLQDSLSAKDKIDQDLNKIKEFRSKITHDINSCKHDTNFFLNNTTCPSCAQDIDEEYKQNIIGTINLDIDKHKVKLNELEDILSKLNSKLTDMNNISIEIANKNIEMSTYNSAITILNRQNAEMYREIDTSKCDTGDISEEKVKLKELANSALVNVNRKTELNSEKDLHDIAGILFKDTGNKTAIIREYLPIMNKLINQYLNQLDSYIHFELDEAFVEKIKSRFRDEFTYASFSEGEKARVDLAILFTWRHIAKMKNSVNTNLLLLDEIFDSSLDMNGTDYFLNLMDSLGEHSNVFVISHKSDQLFDKFKSVIKFEKRNDFSVIV